MTEVPHIRLKEHHNYVAFFLTLACNLSCDYCINDHDNDNLHGSMRKRTHMAPEEWIRAADRLILRSDLPLTLQGGEPTLYKGFYKFVNEVKEDIKMDLLTNLMFDVEEFIKNVPVWRFVREAPYAAIRVSYHPGQNNINDLIKKAFKMEEAGFRVGIYGILHPSEEIRKHVLEVRDTCLREGIDFRTKEFLGEWNDELYGTYKYRESVCTDDIKICECRNTEFIVGPGGHVYRCHSDLYRARTPVAHILDDHFASESLDEFRECHFYGDCNPCDVKVKTNRFQIFGHTSVEIRNVRELQ